MSKYAALRDYLNTLRVDHWNSTFTEIEDVLGFPLPNSARRYQAWWANQKAQGHVQCSGWLEAGWRTSGLNLTSEQVTFWKVKCSNQKATPHKAKKSDHEWNDVLLPSNSTHPTWFKIEFVWHTLGNVLVDQKERLLFPRTPVSPAIYRFTIEKHIESDVYIGEAEEITRRFQHYRTPGVTQRTNQRINGLMMDCLADDGSVEVSIMQNPVLSSKNGEVGTDLTNKSHRRLLEHVAIIDAQQSGAILLNL